MKEYIVTLQKGVDYDEFYEQMVETSNITNVPGRPVEIANERPLSERNTHYFLTEEEAQQLRNDPRVLAVEIPPDQRKDIKIINNLIQTSNFSKNLLTSTGNQVNWGLNRIAQPADIYGESIFPSLCSYSYHLDGTGVDVVILDSGMQINHPEFLDKNQVSRVQQINWYTSSGLPGTQSVNFYRDYDGHGTAVAGVLAGVNYGYAKNARIYSLKLAGLEGPGDPGTGIPLTDCFDVIKGWHLNKPLDPKTGVRRPTVVNMSWGYQYNSYSTVLSGNYRGTDWVHSNPAFGGWIPPFASYGMINKSWPFSGPAPARVDSVDVDVEELIDAGVIVCASGNNLAFKEDMPGGLDYNNFYAGSGVSGGSPFFYTNYYHRGHSPSIPRCITSGSVDSTPMYDVPKMKFLERKANYSAGGPKITCYAPGSNIASCTSDVNTYSAPPYFANSNFKQQTFTGNSFSSCQLAGICALYLQLNPDARPDQVKSFLVSFAKDNILWSSENNNDYTEYYSLYGGLNKFAFIPFATDVGLKLYN